MMLIEKKKLIDNQKTILLTQLKNNDNKLY